MESENEKNQPTEEPSELSAIAESEHDYLHHRLRDELGREPTEDELNEWLRQHTEGY